MACFALCLLAHGAAFADPIRISPTQDLLAAVQEAPDGATLVLGSGRFNGPIYLDGEKRLEIQGASDGSTIVHTDRADAVIMALNGASLRATDLTIETAGDKQLAVYVMDAAAEIVGCRVRGTKGDAFYAEGGSLAISRCDIADIAGSAVMAVKGASVAIADSHLFNVAATGVYLADGASLTLAKSTVGADTPVVVIGGSPEIKLQNSEIHGYAADRPAIYLEQGGTILVADNRIGGGAPTIYVSPSGGTAIRVADNLVHSSPTGGIAISATDAAGLAPELLGNRVIAGGDGERGYGVLLSGAMSARLADNRIVVTDGVGIAFQDGATGDLSGNIVLADSLTLQFSETDAARSTVADDFLLPPGQIQGTPGLGVGTRNKAAAAGEPALFQELVQLRDGAIEMARTGAPPPEDTLLGFFRDLDARLAGIQATASSFAGVTAVAVDAVGAEGFVPFAVLDADGNELSHHDAADPQASLPPGDYLIATDLDPLNAQPMTLAAGENQVFRVAQPETLWLSFTDLDGAMLKHLVKLRPATEREAVVARIRNVDSYEYLAERRASADPADIEQALTLARAWKEGEDDKARPADGDVAGWSRWQMVDRMADRILAVAGDETDIAGFAQLKPELDYYSPMWNEFWITALIESRHGTLESGKLIELTRSSNPVLAAAAALALHLQGIRDYDQIAIDYINGPIDAGRVGWFAFDFIYAMLDRGDPPVRDTVRRLWDRYRQRAAEYAALTEEQRANQFNEFGAVAGIGRIYFLAHGEPEDWQRIAAEPLSYYGLPDLAAFAADPRAMDELMARQPYSDPFYGFLSHLAADPNADPLPVLDDMGDRLYQMGYARAVAEHEYIPEQIAMGWMNNFRGRYAAYFPSASLAEYYYFGAGKMEIDPLTWAYFDWADDATVDTVLAGTDSRQFIGQLDFIPQDRLERLFDEKDASAKLPDSALVLAYHKIATRASWILDETSQNRLISSAVEWQRPFIFRAAGAEKRYGGGLSGRLDVRLHFVGNELRLTIAIPRESYYADFCSWAAQISTGCDRSRWLHHEYVVVGRKLIEAVRLRRGDEVIAMTELPGPAADRYVFTADLGGRDLAGLQAEVDLAMLDQRLSFAFPLYVGQFAKEQRLQAARIASLETRLAAAPSDIVLWNELARALQAYGDIDGAWKNYAVLLDLDPGNLDLWFIGADMYAAVGMPSRSVALMHDALKLHPDNIDLMFTLGAMTYRAGDYAEAKRAFREVVIRAPDDVEALTWEGYAAFLSRDWESVNAAYGAVPEAQKGPAVRLLSLIAMAEGAGGKLDLAQFDAEQKALSESAPSGPSGSVMQSCYADFYGGYRLRFQSKAAEAKAAFDRAAENCPKTSFEHRAAVVLLEP